MITFLRIWALFLIPVIASAEMIPVADFAKRSEFHNAVISPGGDYIAVQRSADKGKKMIAIVSAKDLSMQSFLPASPHLSPVNPIWVSDTKLIVEFEKDYKGYEQDFSNGELLAMDYNGKKKRHIIEHQIGIGRGKIERFNQLHGMAEVVHLLPKEEKWVLIRFIDFKNYRTGVLPKLYKIHTVMGKIKEVTRAPSYEADFTFSVDGEPLYSYGKDKAHIKNSNRVIVHKYEDDKWKPLDDIKIDADVLRVIAVTKNPEEVYVLAEHSKKPDEIFQYNMVTGAKKLVFYHPEVDPMDWDIDPNTGELVAVHYEAGYPDIHLIDPDHIYSKWYPALFQVFNGNAVRITSATDDGSKLVVHVSGANEPGQFHIFNTQTKKLAFLFSAQDWIKSDSLAEVKPISFESRDKKKIHGYLTIPQGAKGKSPMVVLPHGGPYAVRDWWEYDPVVQFLASRGYAVLQVNFRGSTGYGRGFYEAGLRKWGSEIQYDIIDGTRWAAALDSIDENRICIMGGSFGGYSALMSSTIEPDLYECAVGDVGVYDLALMWTTGDIETYGIGKNRLRLWIGEDKEELKRFSPLHQADKLKAAVLLVHGKKDWRVDVKHFDVMVQALKEKGHDYETLLFEKEGHGIANEKNRIKYYNKVSAFLDKHIGSSAN